MSNSNSFQTDIAIVGMSGRFPGASNLDEFWQNLKDGVESISFFSDEEMDSSVIPPELLSHPNYVRAKGVLQDADLFDAGLFGFSPREAEIMDPQQRVFLECAWEALENAGYDATTFKGRIGIYSGIFMSTYLLNNIASNREFIETVGVLQTQIGNDKDHLSTLVAYKLDLKGPAITVQTACSTSLVAAHLGIQSLLNGECDMVLAGGVTITVPEKTGYLYREGGVASPDGHCRAFDAKGQGTLTGNGVGIVVLKRLVEALNDGDTICAVIKGSAVNNDGSFKIGYTAPSIDGQARVIAEAQAIGAVEPESITYVETHGTATPLGDPIEIAALTQAFREATDKKAFCAIGSVKTNIGHLQAAAGAAGLIKTVLSLKHKMIPPSLHFQEANPKIDFDNSPFYVNTRLSEWKRGSLPLRAGVSSFGIGGTNAHLIVEESPEQNPSGPSREFQLLLLSARTDKALEKQTDNLCDFLKQNSDVNFADVAFTLEAGRRHLNHRRAVVCTGINDALSALESRDERRVRSKYYDGSRREVVFMFSGLGDHYVNMASGLYESEEAFRSSVDRCAQILEPLLGLDIREVIYPKLESVGNPTPAARPQQGLNLRKMISRRDEAADPLNQRLNETHLAQPALFVIEYALARLLEEWGIRPKAMIGYSLGEYVAACLAGVFSLEDALKLVARRAEMIHALEGGAMIAVSTSEADVAPLLNESLSLAGVNGPHLCVLSGTIEAVEQVEKQLTEMNITSRRLATTHAFHSKMMTPLSQAIIDLVSGIKLNPPNVPYISDVTGQWITASQATNPDYWAKHLCLPVRFSEGIEELLKDPACVLLEIGPGQMLAGLALHLSGGAQESSHAALPTIRANYDERSDVAFLLNAVGHLWLAGAEIDWAGFYKREKRRRVPLPTYPFERRRYWIEPGQNSPVLDNKESSEKAKSSFSEWFYTPVWKQASSGPALNTEASAGANDRWLIFLDGAGIGKRITEQLRQQNHEVITVSIGTRFLSSGQDAYEINPQQGSDYDLLFDALAQANTLPSRISHLWMTTSGGDGWQSVESFEQVKREGFNCLLSLAQVIRAQPISEPIRITVITNGLHAITGNESLNVAKATILGPSAAIPQEIPGVRCVCIDIDLPRANGWQEEKLISQLIAEMIAEPSDPVIAYRGNQRWVQRLDSVPVTEGGPLTQRLTERGVYLIAGPLQAFDFACAHYLIETLQAKTIVVISPSTAFGADEDRWALDDPFASFMNASSAGIQSLEAMGAEVLTINADPSDEIAMSEAMEGVYARFGQVNGVIFVADTSPGETFRAANEYSGNQGDQLLEQTEGGLMVLKKLFRDKALDFRVIVSPTSFVQCAEGRAAQFSAERFADCVTSQNNLQSPERWLSVHFDAAQWIEEADPVAGFHSQLTALALTESEKRRAVEQVLNATWADCLMLSSGQLEIGASGAVRLKLLKAQVDPMRTELGSSHPRPDLPDGYVAPRDELEQVICDMWQELLGVERVGVYDSFFELGGHSLIGTQLNVRLREMFPVDLPLMTLFELPTVANLAEVIREMLLDKLESLPEDEAQRLI
jgi:acyl transferase domain-containing protein